MKKELKKKGLSHGNQMKKAAYSTSKAVSLSNLSDKEKEEKIAKAKEFYASHEKEGSIASKVNLVDKYNRRNEV